MHSIIWNFFRDQVYLTHYKWKQCNVIVVVHSLAIVGLTLQNWITQSVNCAIQQWMCLDIIRCTFLWLTLFSMRASPIICGSYFLSRCSPNWAQSASLLRFQDHTHTHTHTHTHCVTPLNEWSARHRGRYLQNTQKHKRITSLPSAGFERAIQAVKWLQTYALWELYCAVIYENLY